MSDGLTGLVAPIATIVAALLTALNLGARLTGWGFVLFTVGSVCWIGVGMAHHQTNLIASSGCLTVINVIGCWRWLGRQRAIEDGAKSAKTASRRSSSPGLFTVTGLANMPVVANDRQTVGKAVEGLIECRSGIINYVVVASSAVGGVAEQLRAVPREAVSIEPDRIVIAMPPAAFHEIPPLKSGEWPSCA